jgi:hypothetical protein
MLLLDFTPSLSLSFHTGGGGVTNVIEVGGLSIRVSPSHP